MWDSEEVAGFSGEVALVKTYSVECIGYPLLGFKNDLSLSSISQHVLPSRLLAATGASPQSLRRKFFLHRPFEGGCWPPWEFPCLFIAMWVTP